MDTYPLTGAQKLHDTWIRRYHTQQVSGISMLAALQLPIDFGLFKQCIQLEIERSECLRVRFHSDEEKTVQYIVPNDPRDIPVINLQDKTMEEADAIMQQWAYETFDGNDIPMFEFRMMMLPDGYNGFFLHVDHRLADSAGLVVMITDLIAIYCHFAMKAPMPDDLSSFRDQLETDLNKANNVKRLAKDRAFWDSVLDELGEPTYSDIRGPEVLQRARAKHENKKLRAADIELNHLQVRVKNYYLEPASSKALMDFCMNHGLSLTNLLILGLRTYLSKQNGGQEDISIMNFISRRSTHSEWTSGGSRTVCFPCRTRITPDTEFLDATYEVQSFQNHVYMHSNYDPALLEEQIRKRYPRPENTEYESVYLTYQPLPVRVENEHLNGIETRAVWYANGAATKKLYLTVSHMRDGSLCFSFHYQEAVYDEHDMELCYYYLMRILFKGISQPDLTIGELIRNL